MTSTSIAAPKTFCCNHCLATSSLFEESTPNTVASNSAIGQNKLFLLSCFHLLCQACRSRFNHNCPLCHRTIQMMEVSRRMSRTMQLYFEPLQKSIDYVLNIARFQHFQHELVTNRFKSGLEHLKNRFLDDLNEHRRLKREYEEKLEMRKVYIAITKKCSAERR